MKCAMTMKRAMTISRVSIRITGPDRAHLDDPQALAPPLPADHRHPRRAHAVMRPPANSRARAGAPVMQVRSRRCPRPC
jgi:hypothetical protein